MSRFHLHIVGLPLHAKLLRKSLVANQVSLSSLSGDPYVNTLATHKIYQI
jgi:hypothetical protein